MSYLYTKATKRSLGDPAKERAKKIKPGRYGALEVVPKELLVPKPVVIPEPEPPKPKFKDTSIKRVN